MKSLLVIDDDERIRKIIKIQLKDTEYTVYEADEKEKEKGEEKVLY